MNLVLNQKQKKILLILAAFFFFGLCLWTWRVVFFSNYTSIPDESENTKKEEELPVLEQNVVFTRLPVDTSFSEDVLRERKKRWDESAKKAPPIEYGPDGKPKTPVIYD